MSTLAEIEAVVGDLPASQQEELLRYLTAKLRLHDDSGSGLPVRHWPVPPPDVPREELRRIQVLIDREFTDGEAGDGQ